MAGGDIYSEKLMNHQVTCVAQLPTVKSAWLLISTPYIDGVMSQSELVVSTILFSFLFALYSYCGVCFKLIELSNFDSIVLKGKRKLLTLIHCAFISHI